MSEFANKTKRGSLLAAVFSLQGFGILAASSVTMVVCKIFDTTSNVSKSDPTPRNADIVWRLILMIGAIPAGLTFYWRMMMPETARYIITFSLFLLLLNLAIYSIDLSTAKSPHSLLFIGLITEEN
jgi:hypothetical protein